MFRFKRRVAEAVVNPKELAKVLAGHLPEFEQWERDALEMQDLISKIREIQARDPQSVDQKPLWQAMAEKRQPLEKIVQAIGYYFYLWFRDSWDLGLALIQQFSMQTPVRRKVEQMVKFWVSKQKPGRLRFKGPQIDQTTQAIDIYLKQLKTVREQQAAVLEALARGKPMSEADEVKFKAGPFTLINSGGFKADDMNAVAAVAEKAAALLNKKGLGKVCYGDVHVTKKIGRANVLAFYMRDSDEFFMRAGMRLNVDSLHTVLHELGHRLHRKFLSGKDPEIARLYAKYDVKKMVHQDREELDKSKIPPVGETVKYKGDDLAVIGFDFSKRVVKLVSKTNPKQTFSAPLENYGVLFKGEADVTKVNQLGFVTPYAGKSKEENFAEMVGFYCTDQLSAEQVKDLEEILF